MLLSKNISFDSEGLANKLKSRNDFVSTLAEMESAIFLANQGFAVTFEPHFPEKGPDLRADWEGVPYFVEVRTVGFSEDEERRDSVTDEIFEKLNLTPSSYRVALTVGDTYKAGSNELRDAITAILNSLDALKGRGAKGATLYYAGKGEAVLLLPGERLGGKLLDIREKADFVVQFEHCGAERAETKASFMAQMKHPPEPVDDHERLRKILHTKRKQLPEASRGIIALDVSELFMLSDFSIERALYGDLVVEFARVKSADEAVGEPKWRRNNRGFLLHTSRVSAVVIQKRSVESGEVKIERRVYPTNRADADTLRLDLVDLKRFGDIGDREHLSSENAPNEKDKKA